MIHALSLSFSLNLLALSSTLFTVHIYLCYIIRWIYSEQIPCGRSTLLRTFFTPVRPFVFVPWISDSFSREIIGKIAHAKEHSSQHVFRVWRSIARFIREQPREREREDLRFFPRIRTRVLSSPRVRGTPLLDHPFSDFRRRPSSKSTFVHRRRRNNNNNNSK